MTGLTAIEACLDAIRQFELERRRRPRLIARLRSADCKVERFVRTNRPNQAFVEF